VGVSYTASGSHWRRSVPTPGAKWPNPRLDRIARICKSPLSGCKNSGLEWKFRIDTPFRLVIEKPGYCPAYSLLASEVLRTEEGINLTAPVNPADDRSHLFALPCLLWTALSRAIRRHIQPLRTYVPDRFEHSRSLTLDHASNVPASAAPMVRLRLIRPASADVLAT
jgi:hypothetical protein